MLTHLTLRSMLHQTCYLDLTIKQEVAAKLAYIWLGDKQKPCLVLCQGSNLNMFAWDSVFLKNLLDHYSLFLFDYPGLTGLSSIVNEDTVITVGYLTNILEETLKQLAITPFAIIGYSMGGWIGQCYGFNHPEQALILMTTDAGGPESRPDAKRFAYWQEIDNATTFTEKRQVYKLIFPNGLSVSRNVRVGLRLSRALKIGEPPTGIVLERQYRLYDDWYLQPSITPKLANRSLIMTADKDSLITRASNEELILKHNNAILCQFPDAGHGLPYQYPEEVAKQITHFLQVND